MSKTQCELMLRSASSHLVDIENNYQKYLKSRDMFVELSQKIRYFSVDMESALDYIAFDLFNTYFLPVMKQEKKSIAAIEKKFRNVNFPNYIDEKKHNKSIKNIFPRLHTLHPEISSYLRQLQPFNHKNEPDYWLSYLNSLVNTNKHRHLSKMEKLEDAKIRYMKDMNGNIFKDVYFNGVNQAIVYGDTSLNMDNVNELGISNFDGDIHSYIVFKDDGKKVIDTLNSIYSNGKNTIQHLSCLIEKI